MNRAHKHRALIGYLFLVLVMAGSVGIYQVRTNRELNRRDERSCEQRNRLAQNQRAVLGALIAVLIIEADEEEHPGQQESLLAQIRDLRARQPSAGVEIC